MPDHSRDRDWERLYREQDVRTMPWYLPDLDPDMRSALESLGLVSGQVLDVGSGPGTQAMALAKMGLEVTATDISPRAVDQARVKAEAAGLAIDFRQDDILATRLSGVFDVIFDRGCFHVIPPDQRNVYVRTIRRLLKPGGVLFLKCFSHKQPGSEGPHRLSPDQIHEYFDPVFSSVSVKETVFHGPAGRPGPKALFCTIQ